MKRAPFPPDISSALQAFAEPTLFGFTNPVGSRVTCCPAPMDTDDDHLIYCKSPADLGHALFLIGFELGGSGGISDDAPQTDRNTFQSYTRGKLNFIITGDLDFYKKFLCATALSTRLNLMNKTDRIALFQAVLYSNTVSE